MKEYYMKYARFLRYFLYTQALFWGAASVWAAEPFSEERYQLRMNLLSYTDASGQTREIRSVKDWEAVRPKLFENFEAIAGPFPRDKKRPELKMKVLEEFQEKEYVRQKISFVSESENLCYAWLLIPNGVSPDRKLPAMVCPHPTHSQGKDVPAGLTDRINRNYAQELSRRGYVTVSPDYWTFGDNQQSPYPLGYQSGTMKGIWDHSRCVDLLCSLPFVDRERIGIIGHSLGGHNAIFAALFDERFKAVVTSCGFTSFPKYYGGRLAGWCQDRYMPLIRTAFAEDSALVPSDFNQLLALLAPRPIFVNAPLHDDNFDFSGVTDCVRSAEKVYQLYEKEGLARFPEMKSPDGQTESYGGIYLRHPDCGHDFPPAERDAAYEFLDRVLNGGASSDSF